MIENSNTPEVKPVHPKYDQHKKNDIIQKDKPKSKTKYVDNARFVELISKYKANTITVRETDEMGSFLVKIASGLSQKYQFRGYPFIEELVGEAVIHCWYYFNNFNPDVTKNPFSYFTQLCYYNFLATIDNEKRALATKFKASLNTIAEHGDRINEEVENGDIEANAEYEIDVGGMSTFVSSYDRYLDNKKAKARAKVKVVKGVDKFLDDDATLASND